MHTSRKRQQKPRQKIPTQMENRNAQPKKMPDLWHSQTQKGTIKMKHYFKHEYRCIEFQVYAMSEEEAKEMLNNTVKAPSNWRYLGVK